MANTAVVIGGSIAGLLAGRALADSFRHVVLIEKSELPREPTARPSVPQGQHAHGLLAGGLAALETLLPGLFAELEASGCPTGDNLTQAAWVFAGRRLAFGTSGVRGMTVARPVLEHAIRERVRRVPNIEIRTGLRVSGLVGQGGRITGVRVRDGSGTEAHVTSELVVDASGRTTRSADWLRDLGLSTAGVDEVALETRYASRVYTRRTRDLDGAIALMIVSDPHSPRGGIALALDERRWLISEYVMGGKERPPTDHAGALSFARRLQSPELADLLARAQPLTDTATLRFPSSIRRRYEDLPDPVPGFIACGDALCSFNPTFGQGITVAAKQALVLQELAHDTARDGFERTFFARAARIVDVAWNVAAGRSFLYQGVAGRPTWKMRVANAYMPRVVARAHEDVVVATSLLEVLHFLAPPEALFAPRILRRVLGAAPTPTAERRREVWQDDARGPAPDSFRYHKTG